MSINFAAIPVSNARLLCIGGITSAEARDARDMGHDIQENGFYLFLAAADQPSSPIEILAKFLSCDEAEKAASLMPTS